MASQEKENNEAAPVPNKKYSLFSIVAAIAIYLVLFVLAVAPESLFKKALSCCVDINSDGFISLLETLTILSLFFSVLALVSQIIKLRRSR